MKQFKENKHGYKILTDTGYQDFSGIAYMGDKPIIEIVFDDNSTIKCTHDHCFFDQEKKEIYVEDFDIGDILYGKNGNKKIVSMSDIGVEPVYDIIEVGNGNRFFANGVLSHNCEFITFEETLIDPIHLKGLHGMDPMETAGRVRWYSPILPNRIYVLALDPSMGTGSDNAAITAWMLPEYRQVGEWIHNKTDVRGQVRVLMDMLAKIYSDLKSNPDHEGRAEIYWSVENNSLGEAVLQVIEDTGEDNFAGDFIHEPRKRRKGFTTTHKTKIEACVRMKSLIESGRMEPRSKPLITELKTFVKSNRSYAAKSGDTDDIVMSTMLSVRILSEVQNYEKNLYDRLADIIEHEGEEEPLPAIFV